MSKIKFDDMEDSYQYRKNLDKKKFKGKGHQTKYGGYDKRALWEDVQDDIDIAEFVQQRRAAAAAAVVVSTPIASSQPAVFVPNPEYTQEIKGYTIDFSKVAMIEKIDQEHDGKQTYGIKFLFTGKKGLYRIVWYNTNQKLRDHVFEEKNNYWSTIPKSGK